MTWSLAKLSPPTGEGLQESKTIRIPRDLTDSPLSPNMSEQVTVAVSRENRSEVINL
jgi:hypothetical protein